MKRQPPLSFFYEFIEMNPVFNQKATSVIKTIMKGMSEKSLSGQLLQESVDLVSNTLMSIFLFNFNTGNSTDMVFRLSINHNPSSLSLFIT